MKGVLIQFDGDGTLPCGVFRRAGVWHETFYMDKKTPFMDDGMGIINKREGIKS